VESKLTAMSTKSPPKELGAKDRETWLKFNTFLKKSGMRLQKSNNQWSPKLDRFEKRLSAIDASGSQTELSAATKDLKNLEQSFSLQFLALQQAMQHESRKFQTISNVMKNRHDTAKNSINNIRLCITVQLESASPYLFSVQAHWLFPNDLAYLSG
jgi:hypothetical protein